MKPVTTASIIADSSTWYCLDGGAAVVPMVLANIGTWVPSEVYTTVKVAVCGGCYV